jgi:hypothetical protein
MPCKRVALYTAKPTRIPTIDPKASTPIPIALLYKICPTSFLTALPTPDLLSYLKASHVTGESECYQVWNSTMESFVVHQAIPSNAHVKPFLFMMAVKQAERRHMSITPKGDICRLRFFFQRKTSSRKRNKNVHPPSQTPPHNPTSPNGDVTPFLSRSQPGVRGGAKASFVPPCVPYSLSMRGRRQRH